ncbi:MAG: hypothetical protein P8M80_15145 [Pirellulaceae bacterium]|nr:hypothetical protein [Pirellulaceae bacterium]
MKAGLLVEALWAKSLIGYRHQHIIFLNDDVRQPVFFVLPFRPENACLHQDHPEFLRWRQDDRLQVFCWCFRTKTTWTSLVLMIKTTSF